MFQDQIVSYRKHLIWICLALLFSLIAIISYYNITLPSSEISQSGSRLTEDNIPAGKDIMLPHFDTDPLILKDLNFIPLNLNDSSDNAEPILLNKNYFITQSSRTNKSGHTFISFEKLNGKKLKGIKNNGIAVRKLSIQEKITAVSSSGQKNISLKDTLSEDITLQKEFFSKNENSAGYHPHDNQQHSILFNRITQAGTENLALIAQSKNSSSYTSIEQIGSDNLSLTEQYSTAVLTHHTNTAHVEQEGLYNFSLQQQYQSAKLHSNDAKLQQSGMFNTSWQRQTNFGNNINSQVVQIGAHNFTHISQFGINGTMQSRIRQQGLNNQAFISQQSF